VTTFTARRFASAICAVVVCRSVVVCHTPVSVCVLRTPGDDGGRGQVLSTLTDDCRLLSTLGVHQLCTPRWSIGPESASRGPWASADIAHDLLFSLSLQ